LADPKESPTGYQSCIIASSLGL